MSTIILSDAHIKTRDDCEKLFLFMKEQIINISNLDTVVFLGDIFDFWFEYRGFIKYEYYPFYNMLSLLKDKKIEIHYIAGNHDFALGNFFSDEFNVIIHENKDFFTLNKYGVNLFFAHGDRIHKKGAYKILSWILNVHINKKLFSAIPPWMGELISKLISTKSRERNEKNEKVESEEFKKYLLNLKEKTVSLSKKNNCKFAFVGHTHQNFREFVDGVVFVNTGSWGFYGDYYLLNNCGKYGNLELKKF